MTMAGIPQTPCSSLALSSETVSGAMHGQNWEDEDIPATLEELKESLADNIKLLSSWEKYKKEVLSGSLDWTPMHTSDQFWLENAAKFEERDFQVCGSFDSFSLFSTLYNVSVGQQTDDSKIKGICSLCIASWAAY